MYFFDLIILVNNNEAKIIQNRKYYNTEKEVFNLDIFLRKIKLSKLQKINQKESL